MGKKSFGSAASDFKCNRVSPNVFERTTQTCGTPLIAKLRQIVGRRYVLTDPRRAARFLNGYRTGSGPAAAVVRPGDLVELWRVARACADADAIIILQAANTGLTGGSTPSGEYDRPVVVVSTMRIRGVLPILGGTQVICFPGTTLDQLERTLKPLGRVPHSVIGSSCIGASVVGGVCNNSGGALVRRGPAYTEYAIFGRIEPDGELRLMNHLGVDLGDDPEAILERLERGLFDESDIVDDGTRQASDREYQEHVRDIDAATPARFNADPRRLFEAAGCAGRLIVFAVRLDTFPEEPTTVFHVATNDPGQLTELRRVLLSGLTPLPVAAEYVHRDALRLAARYGRDTMLAIERVGTERLPALFAARNLIERFGARVGLEPGAADRVLQRFADMLPEPKNTAFAARRESFEHHLLLEVVLDDAEAVGDILDHVLVSESSAKVRCTPKEAKTAFLHRFAVAGAAIRYRSLHCETVEDIIALDVAIPRNSKSWTDVLPAELDGRFEATIYYGHFLCHVFHRDYIVSKGQSPDTIKEMLLAELNRVGAEYPAEHNVGHSYVAKAFLANFYISLDPRNQLNPGLGGTSRESTIINSGKQH